MYCRKCGTKLSDNAKFCKNCGEPTIGMSSSIDKGIEEKNNEIDLTKTVKCKEKAKKKHRFLKFIVKSIFFIIACLVVLLLLSYFGVIDRYYYESISQRIKGENELNTEELVEMEPVNADDYYDLNSTVVAKTNAKESTTIQKESEIIQEMSERGFTDYDIEADYSMDGEYAESDEDVHPSYTTYYIASNGDIWTIMSINGRVMANPVSYNMNSDNAFQLILSENDSIMSYDSYTNTFYETIPNPDVIRVIVVEKINTETLEKMSTEGMDSI